MNDLLLLLVGGLLFAAIGVIFLKREYKLFKNSIPAKANVVEYVSYAGQRGRLMYTMSVSYTLPDGTVIRASEQGGSSKKKYPVGTDIDIYYSMMKPDRFIVSGDHSRKIVLFVITILGVLLAAASIIKMIQT